MKTTVSAAITALCLPALSIAADSASGESKSCTGNLGINAATAYINRGVVQNRHGLNFQPYANLSLKAHEGDGFIDKVAFHLGFWSNFTDANSRMGNNKVWSEFDLIPGVSLGMGKFTLTESLQLSHFPSNPALRNFRGLQSRLSYDDSDLLGALALHPTLTHFASLSGTPGFGMGAGGHYWHLGVAPSIGLGPVTLSVPLGWALTSGDFYTTGRNGFAYTSAGLEARYNLPFATEAGHWTANASLIYYNFDASTTGNPSNNDVVGSVGIGVAF